MAQVLHVPAPFPGTPGPTSPPAFPPREPAPPYSVETPYGYRLDLDFVKYVDDIEKGHTLRRVAVGRRPRLGSASWWPSTESLCSTASGDSRHSAYSLCGRGPSGGSNPRVERTLLGARRRLEAQAGAAGALGSLTPGAAGSTGSLSGLGLPPSTPRGSGLSTPVGAGPLALVREQMAGALRKLRELEERVQLIPALQLRLSVLQEEKRRLAVQLKSQRFLGRPRGEPSPGEPPGTRSVATWVRERDLGRPDGEAALAARVAVLEAQLHRALSELRAARGAPHAPRLVGLAASTPAGAPLQPQRALSLQPYGAGLRALQRPAGEAGAEGRPEGFPEEAVAAREVLEAAFPAAAAAKTGPGHQVKKISIAGENTAGLLQAPPVSSRTPLDPPAAAGPPPSQPEDSSSDQDAAHRKPTGPAAACSKEEASAETGAAGAAATAVSSIKKRQEEPEPRRRSPQFVGVNGGGYESSEEDSSTAENFSDNESTENEAPKLEEKVPTVVETPQLKPAGTAGAKASQEHPSVSPPAEGALGSSKKEAEKEEEEEEEEVRMELSPDLISACINLEKYLENSSALTERELKTVYGTVLQEWLRLACRRDAHRELVRRHLITFRAMSPRLLDYVVNMADGSGNTALHYSVSHANFPVVRQLLDSGVCQVDKQNRAGYSAIMLTALSSLKTEEDNDTVLQLLRLGDVNAKASQAGQTALMLAVSHGRLDVVRALLACGADVNVQDDDGSTALMCACEHGHKDIAELLLAQPTCDTKLADHDGSTALTVALDAGQSEIASMLYSRMNIQCSCAPMSEDQGPSSSSAEE